MVATLNEKANKLQTYIIESQSDAHSSGAFNLNLSKYNNIKFAMDETVRYPHVIIRIGISEATYNLRDKNRTEGSLGPDERYVYKWIGNYTVSSELMEIYKSFRDNLMAMGDHQESDEYAIEFDQNGKIKRIYEANAAVSKDTVMNREERRKQIKNEVKDFLRSTRRKLS